MRDLTVDLGLLEFPCRDVVVEEQIDLAKCAILGLGEAEPAPEVAKEIGARVEETSFGTPIPGYMIISANCLLHFIRTLQMGRLTESRKHARRDGVREDACQVVHDAADDNCFVPQPSGWRLRHDGVAGWSNSDHVAER